MTTKTPEPRTVSPLDEALAGHLDVLDLETPHLSAATRAHVRAAFAEGWKAAQNDAAERIREEVESHRYRVDVLVLPSDLVNAMEGLAAELDKEADA